MKNHLPPTPFRIVLLFLPIGLLLCTQLKAQQTFQLHFTQPPLLEVSALDDLVFSGEAVQLGHENMVSGGSGDYIYLWSPQDGLDDPTAARPLASPTDDITYTLLVTDENGCTGTLTQTVNMDRTGVKNFMNLPEVNVYPVPANKEVNLTVSWHSTMSSLGIRIYNTIGQLVYMDEFKELPSEFKTSLNLQDLEAGAYTLVATSPGFTVKRNILLY